MRMTPLLFSCPKIFSSRSRILRVRTLPIFCCFAHLTLNWSNTKCTRTKDRSVVVLYLFSLSLSTIGSVEIILYSLLCFNQWNFFRMFFSDQSFPFRSPALTLLLSDNVTLFLTSTSHRSVLSSIDWCLSKAHLEYLSRALVGVVCQTLARELSTDDRKLVYGRADRARPRQNEQNRTIRWIIDGLSFIFAHVSLERKVGLRIKLMNWWRRSSIDQTVLRQENQQDGIIAWEERDTLSLSPGECELHSAAERLISVEGTSRQCLFVGWSAKSIFASKSFDHSWTKPIGSFLASRKSERKNCSSTEW